MKKTLIYLLALMVLPVLTACEDFLDKREEAEELTEEDIYKDYYSIRGYMDDAYQYLDNHQFFRKDDDDGGPHGGRTHVSVMADESAATLNIVKYTKFWSGNWTFTDKEAVMPEIGNGSATPVKRAYRGIRIMNRVLQNYERVSMTDAQKAEIAGQAHFYRAWFYFQLIKRYGGMPILDDLYSLENDNIPRVTYHESHEWMMEDIEKAIELLPDAWDDSNYGRPTVIAAMAFKSMAQLYDASPLMQNDLDATVMRDYDRDRAAEAARSAYAAIEYLNTNSQLGTRLATADEYQNQFWFEPSALKQVEHIWFNVKIPSPENELRQNTQRAFWLPPEMGQIGSRGGEGMAMTCPTLNIVEMYDRKGTDGIYYPVTDPRSGYELDWDKDPFENRDPRFYNNILIPGQEFGTYSNGSPFYIRLWVGAFEYDLFLTVTHSNQRQFSGFMNRKWLWEECNREHNNDAATLRSKRFLTVFIRVSQLYLDYAEALFEATGSATQTIEGCPITAEQAINVIRNRMGVTNVVYSSPDEFRAAYRRERAVELMFENHRWWDVRRWMELQSVFPTITPLRGVKFHPPSGHSDVNIPPATFTLEEFPLEVETRNYANMKNYWYPLPMFMVGSKSNVVQNPGW